MRWTGQSLFFCGVVGLAVTGAIIWITEYYTGTGFRPVRHDRGGVTHGPRHQCDSGGWAISMESTALPALTICVGIVVANYLAGPVRHRPLPCRPMLSARGHDRGARRLRAGHRTMPAAIAENGGPRRRRPQNHRCARRPSATPPRPVTKVLCHRLGGTGPRWCSLPAYTQDLKYFTAHSGPLYSYFRGPSPCRRFSLYDPWGRCVGLFVGGLLPYLFRAALP